jgi:hypothetical protein
VVLTPRAGGVPLPCPGGQQRGQLVDSDGSGGRRHPTVRRNLQHIPEAVTADRLTQHGIGAVDLVTGHPRAGHPGGDCPGDHLRWQRRLGREHRLLRDTGGGAAVPVIGPGLRQVQRPVDQRVPTWRRIRQVDRDLGVLDPPRGTGVLPLHPDTVSPLLDVAGLVQNQDRVRVTEMLGHVAAQIVTDPVGIPLRPASAAAHAPRPSAPANSAHIPSSCLAKTSSLPASSNLSSGVSAIIRETAEADDASLGVMCAVDVRHMQPTVTPRK